MRARGGAGLGLVVDALTAAGFDLGDFPGLRAGLDARGRPVVALGPVTNETSRQLLHGRSGGATDVAGPAGAGPVAVPPDDVRAA